MSAAGRRSLRFFASTLFSALVLTASAAVAQVPDAPPPPTEASEPETTPTLTAPAVPSAAPAPSPAPPAASSPPASPREDDAAKVAELLGQDPTSATGPSLKLYGFADFNVIQYVQLSDRWKNIIPDSASLYVGKLNVYMEGDIAPDWKSLIEVRYMFMPNGANVAGSYTDPIAKPAQYIGVVPDYSDSDRPVAWGSISIQRAYLQHTFTNFLSVRVGRFLTPWGIWNVDHGSPVIIGPSKPYIIGDGFFPEAQTGLDAFGSVPVGESTLGYHLTLSNGGGPSEAIRDWDHNKALGGRLFLKLYVLGEIVAGISGYGGTVTDRRQQVDLMTSGLTYFNYEHYRELSWAADAQWTWKALHFQIEGAIQDRVWDQDARPVVGVPPNVGVQPDVRRWGFYALLSYRLPWLSLMPYVIYQYYDIGWRGGIFGGQASRVSATSFGLNVRINPSVVFKLEYSYATLGNVVPGTAFEDPLRIVTAQLAWAF